MFQNVNNIGEPTWRDYLERSFGEHAIASLTRTPNTHLVDPQRTPDRPLMEHRWILDGPQLVWIVSSNGLSKWALQCLFTFWNIMILDCNSNYLALYSILFFDTNVYNESWLTYYYQWLKSGNGSTRYYHRLVPTISCTDYNQITMINETQ